MIVKKYPVNHLGDNQIVSIRQEIQSIDGVHAVRVDTVSNTVTVEFENTTDENSIANIINKK